MGGHLMNIQVKANSKNKISEALGKNGVTLTKVFPPKNGWVTICLNHREIDEEERFPEMVKDLSQELKTTVWGFLVHSSSMLIFYLFDKGSFIAKFNSSPDYFGAVSAKVRKDFSPNLKLIKKYCRATVKTEKLNFILKQSTPEDDLKALENDLTLDSIDFFQEEDRLQELAKLIGINRKAVLTSWDDDLEMKEVVSEFLATPPTYEELFKAEKARREAEEKTPRGQFFLAISEGDISKIKKYIEEGFDLNSRDIDGTAPVWRALIYNQMEALQFLISKGANVNMTGQESHEKCVKLLCTSPSNMTHQKQYEC